MKVLYASTVKHKETGLIYGVRDLCHSDGTMHLNRYADTMWNFEAIEESFWDHYSNYTVRVHGEWHPITSMAELGMGFSHRSLRSLNRALLKAADHLNANMTGGK